ncbi:MAG: CBS domain-containing protein [Anaerolineaceae bacterium]|nr:CBS domain-containing protein [Anaerolineaceae bacterium]
MHIALTHEQADFDALASLLGTWLLDETILPVLPARMNRNCLAFIAFYGSDLPFIKARELPPEEVETITLVDTQTSITVKRSSERTRVRVIDHHPQRADLPTHWDILNLEPLGACTTIFVERLHELKKPLSSLQASLLLLGIYEDTGSLTYASTTARDMRAAAYLLEEGASLQLTMDYLNPPLTNGQRQVYERLLSQMENYKINGQKIIIVRGDAQDLQEEISSIAHKLRDLFDPDALFVLVTTKEGIRLVARATTNHVDVSAIAAYFGGGGHARAAAALVRQEGNLTPLVALDKTYHDLLTILPDFIRPPVSVGQIMSRHPLMIPPEMPAREAAHLMQRYGYEGYPVIKEGQVIGLLTRRAVDRALAHKLNLPAGSLMEANEIKVFPGDSLDHLQQIMIQSGWGQIPVVSPEDGEVIGIVTRTDVLKIQAGNNTLVSGRENLTKQLEAALPPARLALLKAISEYAYTRRAAAYIVGGFVRDLLLERPGIDFDVVVEGDAIALARALASKFGGRVVTHKRFGTAKWKIEPEQTAFIQKLTGQEAAISPGELPESLDLISARTEFYDYPTALPTVEHGSIKLDLHRRDFTINTLALRLDGRHFGELYDYYGGLHDLKQKFVRVLHSLSFVDDPTRMLRAVRFEQRFHFKIEQRTLQLVSEARELLRQLSGHRLRHEFDLILAEEKPARMFSRLKELGLLTAIHPALDWKEEQAAQLQRALNAPVDTAWQLPPTFGRIPVRRALAYLVWLIPLVEKKGETIAQKLHLPVVIQSALNTGRQIRGELESLVSTPASQVVERLESTPRPALYALYCLGNSPAADALIEKYIANWQHIHIVTDGNMLRKMGVPAGPIYSHILNTLRSARLDGEINTDEEEQALLSQMIRTITKSA